MSELVRMGLTKAVTEVSISPPIGYDISTLGMRISNVPLLVFAVVNGDIGDNSPQ